MTPPLTQEQKEANENKSLAESWMRDETGAMIRDANGKRWWMDGYLRQNFDFVRTKVSHKIAHRRSDLFVIIDGPVGSGKSTLSFQCARYFDPTFDLSRVVFSVDEFLRVIIDATPGQAVVFDEAIIVNSRSALTEFNKKVIIAMTQIRSKGLYIFFNIPSVFDLDRNLVLNRCHLLLHCFQDTFGDRGRYLSFDHDKLKILYLKGKRLYSYGYPKANFFAQFREYFPLDRLEYEKKKQKEIAKQAKPSKTHKWTRQRNKAFGFIDKHREILFPGLTQMEVCTKISEIAGNIEPWQVSNVIHDWQSEEED
jgi:hypothetical protein